MNGKKIKFNLADLFICVIILFIIIFYSLYLHNINRTGNTDVLHSNYYDVVIEAEKIKIDYIDDIKPGDTAINTDGSVFGEVQSIELSEYYFSSNESDFEIVSHPKFRNLKITVKCNLISEGDYNFSGSKKIVIGEKYDLLIPGAYASGKCVALTKI